MCGFSSLKKCRKRSGRCNEAKEAGEAAVSGRINDWGRSGRCGKRGRAARERESVREGGRDAMVEKKVRKIFFSDVHTSPTGS